MAEIGCLGDIPFEVSEETVRTLSKMKWSGSAKYAVHQRVNGDSLTEFVGRGPDKFSFQITLLSVLNVDPMEEMTKLWGIMRRGEAVPLTIGEHAYGRYRWTITDLSHSLEDTDREGDITQAVATVSLQEYLRG